MVILERLARRIDPNQIQLSEMEYFAGNKGYLIFKRILDILFSVHYRCPPTCYANYGHTNFVW